MKEIKEEVVVSGIESVIQKYKGKAIKFSDKEGNDYCFRKPSGTEYNFFQNKVILLNDTKKKNATSETLVNVMRQFLSQLCVYGDFKYLAEEYPAALKTIFGDIDSLCGGDIEVDFI